MPTFPDLASRITHAHQRLLVARQDEDAVRMLFWSGERNHLLDEYSARKAQARTAPERVNSP